MSEGSHLTVERDGPVTVLTLNRPARKNAITPEMACRLADAFAEYAEGDARALVLTGAGGVFCSGGDLGTMLPLISGARAPETHWDRRVLEEPEVAERSALRRGAPDKPILCAISGVCLAGGFEMMLGTDIRVAAPDALFGLPEARRGVLPFAGSMVRLPRQIPHALAMELLLTGDTIGAERALEIGLIGRIAEDPLAEALEMARRIAANGPLAVRTIKATVLEASGVSLEEGYAAEDRAKAVVMASEDAREGPRAFMEKRAPRFTGK